MTALEELSALVARFEDGQQQHTALWEKLPVTPPKPTGPRQS